MARKITELTAAGAVAPATDLLWIEQTGNVARKITVADLQAGMTGIPAAGTTTNSVLRWSGSGWVEETQVLVGSGGGLTAQTVTVSSNSVTTVTDILLTDNGNIGATQGMNFILDTDNNNTGLSFQWGHNAPGTTSLDVIMSLTEQGALQVTSENTVGISAGLRVDARGDAYLDLRADTNNDTETANPYIRFSQDNEAVLANIGGTGGADLDAIGGTFTGMTNNGFAIHHAYATGSIGLGVNQQCAVIIDDNNYLLVQAPASGDAVRIRHNDTDGYVETTVGDLRLVAAGGDIRAEDRVHVVDSSVAGTAALTVTNAGAANRIAEFIGDSDALIIETVGTGDYRINNTQQNNGITIYDGTGGIDLNYNGSVAVECDNGGVALYHIGTLNIQTQAYNGADNITGAEIRHYDNSMYDIGLAVMPDVAKSSALTISETHAHKMIRITNVTGNITFANDTGMKVDSVGWIVNTTTSNQTLAATSDNLEVFSGDATANNTGNMTLAGKGWCTWYKLSDSEYYLVGVGLS